MALAAAPAEFKDLDYNRRFNAVDHHTFKSHLDVDQIVRQKNLPAAGAPSYPGSYPNRAAAAAKLQNPDYEPSFNARFPPPGHSVGHQRVENYTSGGSSGSGGTSRPLAHHPGHPEWHGSVPDKWMDRNTGRTISRRIVYTAARNGPADSLARNGFSYGCLPYVNKESRKMLGSWVVDGVEGEWKQCRRTVKPPHLIRKEELEGVKWTKKPGFIGPNGYGPDRKLQKLQRRHSDAGLREPQQQRERMLPGDRWSKTLVHDLENWETRKLS